MPSVGRIKQLSVAGVSQPRSSGVAASSASANDVWLWACHGPQRRSADRARQPSGPGRRARRSCAGGLRVQHVRGRPAHVAARGRRQLRRRGASTCRRASTSSEVRVFRTTTELGAGQRYELGTSTRRAREPRPGQTPFTVDEASRRSLRATDLGNCVRFGLTCARPDASSRPTAPPARTSSAIGLRSRRRHAAELRRRRNQQPDRRHAPDRHRRRPTPAPASAPRPRSSVRASVADDFADRRRLPRPDARPQRPSTCRWTPSCADVAGLALGLDTIGAAPTATTRGP